jgi:predicted amidohydrolase YtcJ
MKIQNRLITAIIFAIIFSCNEKTTNMDLIVYNGTIYTVDRDFAIKNSMAIKNGKIIATGTDEEILANYRAKTMIDLDGRFVYPGLIDPHCHFYGYGAGLMNADLTGAGSFEKIIEIIREHDKEYLAEWIVGRGWDQNLWPVKEFPHRDLLDNAFPGRPVLLTRIDGHAAIASSEALRRAGITVDTKAEGGEFIVENGELTGMLIDNAINIVRQHVPEPGYEEKVTALMNAQKKCFEVGLTSVGDAGLDRDVILLMDSLQKSGDLKMRIYAMINPTAENFESFMYRGIFKTGHMNVRSVKLFADGALGSRGGQAD